MYFKINKSVASYWSTRLLEPTDGWKYEEMWLALHSVKSINVDFLNEIQLLLNQVATQLSSRGWVNIVSDLIHI
jgi:hypothetical protein